MLNPDILKLYIFQGLAMDKSYVSGHFWAEDIDRAKLYILANYNVAVLKIDEKEISEETMLKVAQEVMDMEQGDSMEDFELECELEPERDPELDEREERIVSGEIEKNMKKECIVCSQKPKYGEFLGVIQSKDGKKEVLTSMCESCISKHCKDKDSLFCRYKEGKGMVTIGEKIMGDWE